MHEKPFDVVVFGATSFVGKLLARDLGEVFGFAGKTLRWAIAGRSQSKLEALRESLGPEAQALESIVVDAADELGLRDMCDQTRVVLTTVGPYALYGEPLIKVCAETGTDYGDLTGEVHWVAEMIEKYAESAQESGARIVPFCGFDSIPSDLGVFFLQQEAQKRFGRPCRRVKMRVKAIRGGVSGGTAATGVNSAQQMRERPELRRLMGNPYALCPKGHPFKGRQPDVRGPQKDPDFGAWMAPFVMASVNTRVVHWTNSLLSTRYGADFQYDEAMLTGKGLSGGLKATAVTAGLGGFLVAASIGPLRAGLKRFVLPKPGEGPSPEAQAKGFYDLRFHGKTADGQVLLAKVTGERDPGYGSTARIMSQAGACLALDLGKKSEPGGFWSPASLFGERIIERLQAHSGLTFQILEN